MNTGMDEGVGEGEGNKKKYCKYTKATKLCGYARATYRIGIVFDFSFIHSG